MTITLKIHTVPQVVQEYIKKKKQVHGKDETHSSYTGALKDGDESQMASTTVLEGSEISSGTAEELIPAPSRVDIGFILDVLHVENGLNHSLQTNIRNFVPQQNTQITKKVLESSVLN